MQRKKITKLAIDSMIIILMASFVISAVLPDYTFEKQSVNLEEADLDGEESNEEKTENEEQKKNLHEDFMHAYSFLKESHEINNNFTIQLLLQELCLPVITPPPDQLT